MSVEEFACKCTEYFFCLLVLPSVLYSFIRIFNWRRLLNIRLTFSKFSVAIFCTISWSFGSSSLSPVYWIMSLSGIGLAIFLLLNVVVFILFVAMFKNS